MLRVLCACVGVINMDSKTDFITIYCLTIATIGIEIAVAVKRKISFLSVSF